MSFAQAVGQGKDGFPSGSQRRQLSGNGHRNILRMALWMALTVPGIATAFDATYLYDANHRLVGVLNSTGNSTRYVYDDLGNLVRTDSLAPSQFAILGFSPEHGAPGTPVSIFGQGFSTTAASNTVEFNGTVAAVLSSNANQVQVTVPAGATTGPISVAVGGMQASTTDAFVVDGTGVAPSITSVSPLVGSAGATVTIAGTHLDPVAGATSVTLNGVPLVLTTATDTTLSFSTPAQLGGGRFLVTTPYGQATAAQDFFTQVPAFNSIYTVVPKRISIDGASVPASISDDNHVLELLLDGAAGDWLTLQASQLTDSFGGQVLLYDPRGIAIGGSKFLQGATPSLHLMQLPSTGTYTLVVWPDGTATFGLSLERDKVLTPNVALPVSLSVPGQSKRVMFSMAAGQSFGLGLTSLVNSKPGYGTNVTGFDANGQADEFTYCRPDSNITTCAHGFPAFAVNPVNASLSPAGWRQVVLDSEATSKSSATLKLVPDLVSQPVMGTSSTVQMPTVGQQAEQLFQGSAGDHISVSVTSATTTPSGNQVGFSLYGPDGVSVYTNSTSGAGLFSLPKLAQTGQYTLYIQPQYGLPSTFADAILKDATSMASVNGAGSPVSGTVAGQAAWVTVTAVAGQSYTVKCTSAASYVALEAYDANGFNAPGSSTGYCGSSSSNVTISAVPSSATYTIKVYSFDTTFAGTVQVTSP